jgi:hypothetical protein
MSTNELCAKSILEAVVPHWKSWVPKAVPPLVQPIPIKTVGEWSFRVFSVVNRKPVCYDTRDGWVSSRYHHNNVVVLMSGGTLYCDVYLSLGNPVDHKTVSYIDRLAILRALFDPSEVTVIEVPQIQRVETSSEVFKMPIIG